MLKTRNEQLGQNEARIEAHKIKELAHKLVKEALIDLRDEYVKNGVLNLRQEHRKKTGQVLTEEESWFRLVQKHLPGLDPKILIANRDLITEVKREIDLFGQGTSEITIYGSANIQPSREFKHPDEFNTGYFYQKASDQLSSPLIERVFLKLKRYFKEKRF